MEWLSHGCTCRRKRICNPLKQRRHVRIWSKWRHNFSLRRFWWTRINIASPKLAEKRNQRDKQKKYPEPLEVYLMRGIKTGTAAEQNNKNNESSDTVLLVFTKRDTVQVKSAFFSWPSEWWHMVQKMTTLIFRSKITHDELINVV